ncbi:MAG: hypothetical protein IJ325_03355, partial [Clostridia bacterium]|nr:hypothetical protein [Clostridia bacterium]
IVYENKNAPDRNSLSVKDEQHNKTIRCATLIHIPKGCALSEIPTYLRQITSAYNVAEYSEQRCSFDCALSGPFAKQFLTRLSAPRVLCVVLIDVISASTVYDGVIIARNAHLVNRFLKIFKIIFLRSPRIIPTQLKKIQYIGSYQRNLIMDSSSSCCLVGSPICHRNLEKGCGKEKYFL